METQSSTKPFALGETVITANALAQLQTEDVHRALARHARGDWGDLDPEDAATNELSITEGFRLLSAYTDRHGVKFWIITEWDRSVTTVVLPGEN